MHRRIAVLAAVLFLLCAPALAEGADEILDQVDLSGLTELSEDAGIDMRELILSVASGDSDVRLAEWMDALKTTLGAAVREAKNIFLAVLIPGALSGIGGRFLSERMPAIRLIAALAAAAPIMGAFLGLMESAEEIVRVSSAVSNAALPVAEVLMTLSGGSGSASLLSPLAAVGAELMAEGFGKTGVQLAAFAASVAVAGNMGNYVKLDRLYRLLKKGTEWAIGLSLTLFFGALSVNGMLGKGMDATAVSAAKYAVDSVIPVVGSEMSDALESVVVSAMHVKNAAGIGCMLLTAALCLAPLAQLGAALLAFRLASAAMEPIADGTVLAVSDGVSGAVEMLLALATASVVLSTLILGQTMAAGGAIAG